MRTITRHLTKAALFLLVVSFSSAYSEEVPFSTAEEEFPRLVRDIQAALASQGYDPGPIDGLLGDKTVAALDQFQEDNEIDSGDIVETYELLGVTMWKACFWLGDELKCPLGCSASILATESGVVGYMVECPDYDPTLIPLPNRP